MTLYELFSNVVLTLSAGLVLFLYGVFKLSATVMHNAGERAKRYLQLSTSHIIKAIIVGAIVTLLIGSSSAVIIITIVLVNAHLIHLKGAMGIVMGANIGTTVSSQLIALDIAKFAPIIMLMGFVLQFVFSESKGYTLGQLLLYFGMIFFGIQIMEWGVEPLKEHDNFEKFILAIEHPVQGALTGAFTTLIIQSSSATVGMAIVLAKKGLITLKAGISVMIGAELGTCSDTLLATIRSRRPALKTGLFHLFFNLISVLLGLVLFEPFVLFIEQISLTSSIEQDIANAHMMFNILGVLFLGVFVGYAESILNKILPDKEGTATDTLKSKVFDSATV